MDLIRLDQYNRTMVACPAGSAPPSWLALTEDEKAALVHPDNGPKPKVHTSLYGFNPAGRGLRSYQDQWTS